MLYVPHKFYIHIKKHIFFTQKNGPYLHKTVYGVDKWKCEVGGTCPEETGHCCSKGKKPTTSRMQCTFQHSCWWITYCRWCLASFFRNRLPAGHKQRHTTTKQTHFWQEIDNDPNRGPYLIRMTLPSYLKELWTELISQFNQSSLSLRFHSPGTISQPVTGCMAVTNCLVRSEREGEEEEGEKGGCSCPWPTTLFV